MTERQAWLLAIVNEPWVLSQAEEVKAKLEEASAKAWAANRKADEEDMAEKAAANWVIF